MEDFLDSTLKGYGRHEEFKKTHAHQQKIMDIADLEIVVNEEENGCRISKTEEKKLDTHATFVVGIAVRERLLEFYSAQFINMLCHWR